MEVKVEAIGRDVRKMAASEVDVGSRLERIVTSSNIFQS
jgi:hypothetical protein